MNAICENYWRKLKSWWICWNHCFFEATKIETFD